MTHFDPLEEAKRKWIDDGNSEYADGMSFVTSIMRSHQIMLGRVEAVLRPMNLTFARYELLTLLRFSKTGKLPTSKISQRLQVHPTSTTNAVDRLEKAGASRTPSAKDLKPKRTHSCGSGGCSGKAV